MADGGIERYQWQGGHTLELRPLTDADYRRWVRAILPAPRPARVTTLEELYHARRGRRPARLYYAVHGSAATFGRALRVGSVEWVSCRGVELVRRWVGREPWTGPVAGAMRWRSFERGLWIGAHIAQPEPHLFVFTPPVGALAALRPPALSRKWALRVTSFDSARARAWALRDDGGRHG